MLTGFGFTEVITYSFVDTGGPAERLRLPGGATRGGRSRGGAEPADRGPGGHALLAGRGPAGDACGSTWPSRRGAWRSSKPARSS
ncbi:MAG: hypothetical protein MZU95_01115 [Desulfomicrobium escambiense]|nr:hypothetical protein [Desulfomicrobium escambiense]